MAEQNPTVIIAHLDDEKLRKSIDSLVGYVDKQFQSMVSTTTTKVGEMQAKLNELSQIKVDSNGSADGGSSRRAKAIQSEKQSLESLQMSYDKLLGALQMAQRQERIFAGKDIWSLTREELDKYSATLQRVSELEKSLSTVRGQMSLAMAEKGQFAPNMKEYTDGLVRTSDELKKMSAYYKGLEKDAQRAFRVDLANAMKMPTTTIDEIRSKWVALKRLIEEPSAVGIFTPNQIANAKTQLDDLWGQLSRNRALQEQINADTQQQIVSTNLLAEAEQKYGVEIAHTAQYFRESAEGFNQLKLTSKDGFFTISNPVYNAGAKSIEEQLVSYKALNQEANLQLEVEKAINIERQKSTQAAQTSIAERQRYNEQRRIDKENVGEYDQLRAVIASVIGIEQKQVRMADIENDSYKALSATLKQLKEAYNSLQSSGRKSEMGESIVSEIQAVQRGMQEIQKTMARPVSLDAAFNLPEKTLDQITYKVQMLRSYIQNLDVVEEHGDIKKVEDAIERLNEKSKNAQKSTRKILEEVNQIRFDKISKMPTDNLGQIGAKIREVRQYINGLKNQPVLDEKSLKRAESLFDSLTKKFDKLHKVQGTDSNVNRALRMQANTLNEIAEKTQRLQAIRANLDSTKQANLIQRVNNALADLGKRQNEIMGKNTQMISSNNALARSWNYMKNRLAFYFTVGASTQFVKNLIEVRSQYEMNERALGILIDSAERGTQIFNELSQMALVSPYTLIELSSAAKQLTAYDVAAKDVVDTTRRLADMASAIGIPIERLTYALGQIKAYGYLNSRDARMFLNAGIPLVKSLADHYTELEGKMVSVGDVYDRMKKKAIGYNDVMQVITEMTDEGGKFFDFQAKMADTLKVQLANLTLAWNNMLNEIGKSEQGVLVGGIKGLKELFLQWEKINTLVRNLAITFGFAKLAQVIQIATLGMDAFGKKMVWQILVGKELQVVLYNIAGSLKAIVTSPLTWWALLATAVVSAGMALYDANKALKEFNKSIADGGKENYENTKKFLQQYQDLRNELQINNGTQKGGRITSAAGVSKDEAEKAWVAIREQIELTSQSSDYFIGKLLSIDDVNKRVEKGFDYLQKIQDVYGAMSSMDDDTIAIKETYNEWWNLGLAQDGVIGNLKEYIATKKLAEEEEKKGAAWHETETIFAKRIESLWSSADIALQQYRRDLDVTLESMANFAQTQGFDFDQEKEFFSQTINKIVTSRNLGEREALQFRLDAEERYKDARIKQFDEVIEFETKRAGEAAAGAEKDRLLLRVKAAQQEKAAWLAKQEEMYGEGRVLFEGFTKYMTRNHGSELQKLFGNMTKKEIEQINWSEPRWKKWAEDNAKAFAEQFGVSFDKLKKYVNDANKMTIFIRTIVQKPDDKSVYDTLTEADKAADEAWNKIQRLKTRKGELEAKGASMVGTSDIDTEYANTIQEITEAQEDYNAALAKGGHSKKENTTNTKEQKQAETELQKALKDELSLLDKVRSQYKKLTDAGVDGTTALNIVTNQFTNSIQRINNILGRNGLPLFNIKAFVGTDNPNAVLEMLKKQLDAAKVAKNIKPSEIKELEVKYGEIVIDAKVYNTKKITDGLNNELSKIKDEYELAVELDANPELGGIFMDIFDIDPNNLPNTIDAYATKVMEALNRSFEKQGKGFRLDTLPLTDDDLKAYKAESEKQMGAISEEDYKNIEKYTKEIRNLRKKDREDTLKQTQDLQYKLGDVNEKIAIESKKLADLQVKYQKETNDEKKRLLDLQIKDQQKVIDELKSQALSLMPEYARVFNSIAEHSAGVARRLQRDLMKVYDSAIFDSASNSWTLTSSNGTQTKLSDTQYRKEREKLTKEMRKSQSNFQKIKEAFKPSDKDGVVDYAKGLELVAEEAKKAADGLHTIADIVDALGGSEDAVEVLNDVATSMEGVATAGQGIAQISSGDYIGGAVNVIKGTWQAVSTWLDNADKKISRQIEESERHVKALEISYQDLQDAMEDAYGYGEVAAKRATITNKELQLVELQRQLQLEKSRKKKNQDANRIMELQSAIINLRNELDGSTKDIVNDLLGISSVGDAAEQLVSSMIDAFKNGEDYMKVYEGAFEDMIDNLIMKAIVGEIVGRKVQQMFDAVEKESTKRADKTAYSAKMPSTREMLEELYPDYGITEKNIRDYNNIYFNRIREAQTFEEVLSAYEKSQADALQRGEQNFYDMLQKQKEFVLSEYADAATIRPEDLSVLTPEWKESWMDGVDDMFKSTMDTLGITFGEGAEKSLSNLQQGIQGITEETAGALEAITNGISQQCYLQSDLLTQIRDAVVAIDSDVQIATNAQILLQLQQSYAVQMAIQSILMGWSTPSGLAVRVELNS